MRGGQAGTHMQGGSCGEVRAAVLLIATTAVANIPMQRLKQVSSGGAAGVPSLIPTAAAAAAAVGGRWAAAQVQKLFLGQLLCSVRFWEGPGHETRSGARQLPSIGDGVCHGEGNIHLS